jgi:hypothetical protein
MSEASPPRPPHVGGIPLGKWFGLSAKQGARILAALRLPGNEPGQAVLARELLAEQASQGGRLRTRYAESRKLIYIAETLRRVAASEEAAQDLLRRSHDPRREWAQQMLPLDRPVVRTVRGESERKNQPWSRCDRAGGEC